MNSPFSGDSSLPVLPASLSLSRLSYRLNPEILEPFHSQGFVVIDEAFPLALALAYRREIQYLYENSLLKHNVTAFVIEHQDKEKPTISQCFPKPQIFEGELIEKKTATAEGEEEEEEEETIYSHTPQLEELLKILLPHMERIFSRYFPELELFPGKTSIKVQYNQGNGAFPYHYDSPGNLKDSRRLTALLYLNPSWTPEHGGELLLQPYLKPAVEIPPILNRLVLFKSSEILHRVKKSQGQERYCLTLWFHGHSMDKEEPYKEEEEGGGEEERGNSHSSPQDSIEKPIDSILRQWIFLFSQLKYQRILSKCFYYHEWRESFIESHRGYGDDKLVLSLDREVERLLGKDGGDGQLEGVEATGGNGLISSEKTQFVRLIAYFQSIVDDYRTKTRRFPGKSLEEESHQWTLAMEDYQNYLLKEEEKRLEEENQPEIQIESENGNFLDFL